MLISFRKSVSEQQAGPETQHHANDGPDSSFKTNITAPQSHKWKERT